MKVKVLSVILTCIYFSPVKGLDHYATHVNGTSGPGRRVIHGDIAIPKNFKFLVRVQAYIFVCSGSIISNNFILTAARCIHNQVCELTKIFPSTWTLYDETDLRAADCWYHEKHNLARQQFYDIGLLRTDVDLLKDPRFEKIPLPGPATHPLPGTPAVIAGWGETEAGVEAMHLRQGDVFVDAWETCNAEFKKRKSLCTHSGTPSKENIPRTVLCTEGGTSKPSGICTNDYGGPVIIDDVVVGIVSSTYPDAKRDCADGAPSLHTNVADYLRWIYGIIEPNKDTSRFKEETEDADDEPSRSLIEIITS